MRKNNGDKGGTLFPRFKEKFKRVSCHWKREEGGGSLVNEGERKNVSSKNSSREKKKKERKEEKKLRTFQEVFTIYTPI